MAKYCNPTVLDAAWNTIKNTCTRMIACSAQPTSYYEAVEAEAFVGTAAVSLGAVVRPATRNGFVYEVTTAGTTGAAEPVWPTTAGTTVTSGTAVFTCRANYAVADVAMVAADLVVGVGTPNGRTLTVAAKNAVAIDVTATANHVALVDDTGLKLLYVTTATAIALTTGAGNTVNFPSWKANIADPV